VHDRVPAIFLPVNAVLWRDLLARRRAGPNLATTYLRSFTRYRVTTLS
jgi:hypothetical protein